MWDPKSKAGIAVAALFAPATSGMIDFNSLNPLETSVAAASHAGFHSVAQIGNLSGSSAAIVASYLPMFDHNFATHLV